MQLVFDGENWWAVLNFFYERETNFRGKAQRDYLSGQEGPLAPALENNKI
jgi:hypothetical protein